MSSVSLMLYEPLIVITVLTDTKITTCAIPSCLEYIIKNVDGYNFSTSINLIINPKNINTFLIKKLFLITQIHKRRFAYTVMIKTSNMYCVTPCFYYDRARTQQNTNYIHVSDQCLGEKFFF